MNQKNKAVHENTMLLAADDRAAQSMGLSYGKYKALTYTPSEPQNPPQEPQTKKHKQEYIKHHNRFILWQKGYSDGKIAAELGVSKVTINKWRDTMELPPVRKCTDRDKYRLVETEYGVFAVTDDDDI